MESINKWVTNKGFEATAISDIRRCHPFFRKLTYQGSRIFFHQGKLIKLKPSETLFLENSKASSAYIVLCGRITMKTVEEGTLGVIATGDTVGEEVLLIPEYQFRYTSINNT
jgi:CRP-like cAMP-binding protein